MIAAPSVGRILVASASVVAIWAEVGLLTMGSLEAIPRWLFIRELHGPIPTGVAWAYIPHLPFRLSAILVLSKTLAELQASPKARAVGLVAVAVCGAVATGLWYSALLCPDLKGVFCR
jgi:hypothetical protein